MPPDEPQVLRPYHPSEAATVPEAATYARRSVRTVRWWCEEHHLGRRIGGAWFVSRVALQAFLEGDHEALRLYLQGDRTSPAVTRIYRDLGLGHLVARWSRAA
jgi:hypothetical protein